MRREVHERYYGERVVLLGPYSGYPSSFEKVEWKG
jgi:hypothetical protein